LKGDHVCYEAIFHANGGSVGHMGAISPPTSGESDAQRRSQRVMLKVSVVVLAQGPDNKPVSEVTQTVTVNAHGAKVLMRVRVSIGQLLTLRHSGTEEQVLCRVAYVSPHQSEKREVGLDFMKPCPGFWRISFPPPDWTMRSPEAKSPTRPSSTPGRFKK
jgi:hypothetical protein